MRGIWIHVQEFTELNGHSEALLRAAKYLGAEKIVKRVLLLMEICEIEGETPADLCAYRRQLKKELDSIAFKKLSTQEFKEYLRAF